MNEEQVQQIPPERMRPSMSCSFCGDEIEASFPKYWSIRIEQHDLKPNGAGMAQQIREYTLCAICGCELVAAVAEIALSKHGEEGSPK